jgi:uncharacterized repeat protein (TIGR03803 family)
MPYLARSIAVRLATIASVALLCLLSAAFADAQTVSLVAGTAFTKSNVIVDAAGNLYGTTQGGGTSLNCHGFGCGTVFELSPASGGGWTLTVLHNFSGGNDGQWPAAGLVLDSAGNLYGTTQNGGGSIACTGGCGTVFKVSPSAGGTWTESVLYRFTGGNDGAQPVASLLRDDSGTLYGTAASGGASTGGVVFKLTNSASGWKQTVLHNFVGADGQYPESGLIRDSAGHLYGTTGGGGAHSSGVVYQLANGASGWTIAVLHDFTGGRDGYQPVGNLTLEADSLYGATSGGGNKSLNLGSGVVYRVSRSGSAWKETVLHAFTGGADGGIPSAGVTFDPAGNLYGTTDSGAPSGCDSFYGCGQVFQLKQTSGNWTVGNLYPVPSWLPSLGGLTRDASGTLFFTASDQHYFAYGNVYQLTP